VPSIALVIEIGIYSSTNTSDMLRTFYGAFLIALFFLGSCAPNSKEYEQLIGKADSLNASEQYQDALQTYKKAAVIRPDEAYPNEKIEELNARIKQVEMEKLYRQFLEEADEAFDNENWEKARTAYLNASNLKPEDAYPIDRIAELDSILKSQKKDEVISGDLVYHVVVGSFQKKSNAERFLMQVDQKGYNGTLVVRHNGTHTAVILKSFATIHEAYNFLPKASEIAENPWVIHKRF
jgi:tetratricopeptide (TPR) repeat protein